MIKAKSYKVLFLFITFLISITMAIGFMSFGVAKAAPSITPSNYFEGNYKSLSYKDGNVVAEVESEDSLTFRNNLVLDDLKIELNVSSNIKALDVRIIVNAFDANGNMRVEGDKQYFDTTITLEHEVESRGDVALKFGVNKDNFVTINGQVLNVGEQDSDYYKVKHVDKTAANISFMVGEVTGDNGELIIKSVDQKASDASGKYKQTFALNEAEDQLASRAVPRAVISENFFTQTKDGYVLNKVAGTVYTVSLSSYSVTGTTPSGDMYLTPGSVDSNGFNIFVTHEDNSKKIVFNLKNGADSSKMIFNVSAKISSEEVVIESYEVTAYNSATYDNVAPSYRPASQVAKQIESFKTALNNATITEGHSINLGEKIKIPSLANFIFDDMTSYSDMTITYHYVTPSNEEMTTTSTKSVALDEAGVYRMYATFTDKHGGTMTADQFYTINDDQTIVPGEYFDYVFSFTINDDAPIGVEGVKQDDAIIGVKYNAIGFDIVASGYTTVYTLWYNSNINATKDSAGWRQIVKASKANANGENGFTYEEMKAFNYDGEVSFIPTTRGVYMIDCQVVSEKSYRSAEDFVLIRALDKFETVKPANYWLRDNMVSVIFLGLGTLCLVGIVVLLFVKPKDADERD